MMDRLNAVQKTVFAIIIAGMVMLVAIPLLFFITVSFSNSTEMTQFPKNIFPSGEVTVYVEPKDDGKYELFYDYQDGSGYTSIITTNNASKPRNILRDNMRWSWTEKRFWRNSPEPGRKGRGNSPSGKTCSIILNSSSRSYRMQEWL